MRGLLAHGKGLAFLVDPEKGTLGPFETVAIKITAHSNMWGDYEDHLICEVHAKILYVRYIVGFILVLLSIVHNKINILIIVYIPLRPTR